MKRAAALMLALLTTAAGACDWNDPGADPFTGSMYRAVFSMDAPLIDRASVWIQMRKSKPVDHILIDREGIKSKTGAAVYGPQIRAMSWGAGKTCPGVADRSKWESHRVEPAVVYSSGNLHVMVAEVCGNPARVDLIGLTGVVATSGAAVVGQMPEPASLALAVAGIAALVAVRRSK